MSSTYEGTRTAARLVPNGPPDAVPAELLKHLEQSDQAETEPAPDDGAADVGSRSSSNAHGCSLGSRPTSIPDRG